MVTRSPSQDSSSPSSISQRSVCNAWHSRRSRERSVGLVRAERGSEAKSVQRKRFRCCSAFLGAQSHSGSRSSAHHPIKCRAACGRDRNIVLSLMRHEQDGGR